MTGADLEVGAGEAPRQLAEEGHQHALELRRLSQLQDLLQLPWGFQGGCGGYRRLGAVAGGCRLLSAAAGLGAGGDSRL
jgi:hypothetical protein